MKKTNHRPKKDEWKQLQNLCFVYTSEICNNTFKSGESLTRVRDKINELLRHYPSNLELLITRADYMDDGVQRLTQYTQAYSIAEELSLNDELARISLSVCELLIKGSFDKNSKKLYKIWGRRLFLYGKYIDEWDVSLLNEVRENLDKLTGGELSK